MQVVLVLSKSHHPVIKVVSAMQTESLEDPRIMSIAIAAPPRVVSPCLLLSVLTYRWASFLHCASLRHTRARIFFFSFLLSFSFALGSQLYEGAVANHTSDYMRASSQVPSLTSKPGCPKKARCAASNKTSRPKKICTSPDGRDIWDTHRTYTDVDLGICHHRRPIVAGSRARRGMPFGQSRDE